jgi:TorA maturation chaperone TorD
MTVATSTLDRATCYRLLAAACRPPKQEFGWELDLLEAALGDHPSAASSARVRAALRATPQGELRAEYSRVIGEEGERLALVLEAAHRLEAAGEDADEYLDRYARPWAREFLALVRASTRYVYFAALAECLHKLLYRV